MTDQDLRELLRGTQTPPTRLTLEGLVERGRRSVRRRRYGLTGTAAAGVALAIVGTTTLVMPHPPDWNSGIVAAPSSSHPTPSAPAATPTQPDGNCTVEPLVMPTGITQADAHAVDPSGHLIAGLGPHKELVLWRDGAASVLPPVAQPGDYNVLIGGVNTAGVIVGTTVTPTSTRAWIYRDGAVTTLPAPSKYPDAYAKAVNAAGNVAGFATGVGGNYVAVVWPAAAPGTVTLLSAPPPAETDRGPAAYGIGDDGTVVGDLEEGAHPYYWQPSGQGHYAKENPRMPGGRITAISGDFAVGWVDGDTGSGPVVARWNLRTDELTIIMTLDGPPTAVAADGTFLLILPMSRKTLRVPPGTDIARVLPSLGPPGEVDGRGLSADGRTVIGNVGSGDGPADVAVVWHCA